VSATAEPAQVLAEAEAPRLVTELPGPRARAVVERDARVTSPSLPRAYPLVPARAAGCVVEDVDGNLLLDFNAGIAVTSTGHAHPEVVEAVRAQAGELLHYSASDFYLPVYVDLCERLAALYPGGHEARVFLTNSGTEAVEAAVKLARWHTQRQYVVAFFGSFHGRSYGSASLTASKARYRARFGPLLPGVLHAPYADSFRPNLGASEWSFPTAEYLEGVLFERLVEPEEVAAVVVEPIQGEGGYVVPPPGWLAALRALCDRHGILLVADEVQSGIGRTGRMWAVEREGVEPDILVAGKGIASGLPLGAMLARTEVATWTAGTHGSTYGGNPVACAAALATLRLVEGGLAERAAAAGDRLLAGLRALAGGSSTIREVRGAGLMVGVELSDHDTAAAVEQACFRRGLLVLSAGDAAIRLSPPLVVTDEQVDRALTLFAAALADAARAARP
jgi:4-aminobutyrate aminotransferase